MDRRKLIIGGAATAILPPSASLASKSRERRALESQIRFLHSGAWIVPTALIMLTAAGPFGWKLNRQFRQFPVEAAFLTALAGSLLRKSLEDRIKGATLWADVFLYANILAMRPVADGPLPKIASVTHDDTEWSLGHRPRKLKLSGLPAAGSLFRNRVGRAYATDDELVIFLRPTLIKEPD